MKSNFDQIRGMVHNIIRRYHMTDKVQAKVTELPDGCTNIEVQFPQDVDPMEWVEIADYLFGHFGGDNDSGKFTHISADGDSIGCHVQYVVR